MALQSTVKLGKASRTPQWLRTFKRYLRRKLGVARALRAQGPAIAAYLQNSDVQRLQLGCGESRLPGWLNTDGFAPSSYFGASAPGAIVYLDVAVRFPIPDSSIDYIFHEHLIEHMDYLDGQRMLRECFRVLRPGGKMRVSTPDLAYFAALCVATPHSEQLRFIDEYVRLNSSVWSKDLAHVRSNQSAFVVNHCVRAWGHLFLYDQPTLAQTLGEAGFVEIIRAHPRQSSDPMLRDLEMRDQVVGVADALVVECTKP